MITYHISQKFDSKEKSFLHLVCEGDLTIRNIEEIKQKITFPMQKITKLELVLREVHALDFSFLQLTLSMVKEFMEQGNKTFLYDFQLGDEFSQLLDKSGMISVFNKYKNIKSA